MSSKLVSLFRGHTRAGGRAISRAGVNSVVTVTIPKAGSFFVVCAGTNMGREHWSRPHSPRR